MLRVTSGNFLEMFDFFLFGFYASQIAHSFFPNSSPFAGLMLTFVTFGVGFLMRPLGAIVLGAYTDQVGRRKGLGWILSHLWADVGGFGTALLAFTPGYASIGIAAQLLVLLGRLIRGFSAGAWRRVGPISPPKWRRPAISLRQAGSPPAMVSWPRLGDILHVAPGRSERPAYPFLVGCLIQLPFIFMLRRSLQETESRPARTG